MMLSIREALLEDENVMFAYIFGSVARGTAHGLSDVDIAVYLRDPSTESYLKLLGRLPTRACKELDVVLLNTAPPLLCYRIIKEGKLLFARDRSLLSSFIYTNLLEALEIKESMEPIRREKVRRIVNAAGDGD